MARMADPAGGQESASAKTRQSPMVHGYLVRNRVWNAWLRVSDAVLRVANRRHGEGIPPLRPTHRVLVCVGGRLGDAVIATRALAELHAAIPGLEIGVLTASWNRIVLENLPFVRRVHVVDHWKLSRAPSRGRRYLTYRRMRAAAIAELRSARYDVAVDLYAYYPNSATLLAAAGIPIRLGYTSGGYGARYTHRRRVDIDRHVSDDHRALLALLVPNLTWHETPESPLGTVSPATQHRLDAILAQAGLSDRDYVVVHPGSGDAHKQWPVDRWIAVVSALIARDVRVVMTGAGQSDARVADTISRAAPGAVNLCDTLSWPEFREVVSRAAQVLTVDTVAVHVASAEATPCVALVTGIDRADRWMPAQGVRVLQHPVSCAPCYRSRGCHEMTCISAIPSDAVVSEVQLLRRAVARA